jgi:hypothetical protein
VPNLVTYLHVRLNLNIAEDAEIYRNLTKLPEGERSRTVRVALLTYFKGEITAGDRGTKRTKIRRAESKPRTKNITVPDMAPQAATDEKCENMNQTPQINNESARSALDEMLDLIE